MDDGRHDYDLPWSLHDVCELLEALRIHPGRSARPTCKQFDQCGTPRCMLACPYRCGWIPTARTWSGRRGGVEVPSSKLLAIASGSGIRVL